MIFHNISRAVMDVVYPPVCYVCENPVDAPRNPASFVVNNLGGRTFAEVMGSYLCPACAEAFAPVDSPLCTICGAVFKSKNSLDHICGECRRVPKFFQSARAAGIYERSLMTVLRQLKYNGRIELAAPLSELLSAAFLKWYDRCTFDGVIPVPLHKRKQRQRGFNQAWLLIRRWCRSEKSIGVLPAGIKIHKRLLVRTRLTRSQTALSRQEREKNVRGAFALSDNTRVKGRTFLLVDDVYTTGATVNECARVLVNGGASRVDVLTAARVR